MHYRRRMPAAHFDDAQVILPSCVPLATCGSGGGGGGAASAELVAQLDAAYASKGV
jgi:hypothetical protein